MTYRLTRTARRDLREISDFWTLNVGQDIALRVVSGILETVITISSQPTAGVSAGQFGPGIRKFPAGKYMIYYRIDARHLEILHVFHGARDQQKAWIASSAKSRRS